MAGAIVGLVFSVTRGLTGPFGCVSVTRWVFVLDRYALAVGSDDRAMIEDSFALC